MRTVGLGAEAALLVRLVVLVIALEPDDLAVALEGQDMGGDAVQEPAIVADDDRAAGEILQPLFQRPQRIDVEIVGRFVEQQQIAPSFSIFARWTRLRSPPESWPTFFCWSPPLKLNAPT